MYILSKYILEASTNEHNHHWSRAFRSYLFVPPSGTQKGYPLQSRLCSAVNHFSTFIVQLIMQNNYSITTDKAKINIAFVHQYLSNESYWAKNISVELVKTCIENSVCFSIFFGNEQVGFARVITDKATFGYIADLFIIEAHRGKGLSKWLMQTILDCKELQGFRGWMLGTKDAHSLYEKFGFKLTNDTTRIMRKQGIEGY